MQNFQWFPLLPHLPLQTPIWLLSTIVLVLSLLPPSSYILCDLCDFLTASVQFVDFVTVPVSYYSSHHRRSPTFRITALYLPLTASLCLSLGFRGSECSFPSLWDILWFSPTQSYLCVLTLPHVFLLWGTVLVHCAG